MHDVAKLANVSPSTVSKYVNKKGYVAPDTRKRLQSAIEQLNYHPNKAARLLKTKASDQIAVILPNLTEKLYNTIFIGISSRLQYANYKAVVFTTNNFPETENDILRACSEGDYAGVILCSCQTERSDELDNLIQSMPVVFLLRMPAYKDVNFIGFDHAATMYALTDALLKAGIEDILLYTEQDSYSCEKECITGFLAAFDRNGKPIPEDALDRYIYSYPFSKESTYRIVMRILDGDHCPRVFLASSREIADAIAEVVFLKGIAIGQDLYIVTLGEESWYDSMFFDRMISTFRPAHMLGEIAAKTLVTNISSPVVFEKTYLKLKDEFPCENLASYLENLGCKPPVSVKKKQQPLRILFPSHEPGFDAMKCLVSQYARHSGCDVVIESCAYHDMYQIYKDMMQHQSSEYDILAVDALWTAYLANGGLLMDVSDLNNGKTNLSEKMAPGFLDAVAGYKNKLYGYPFSYATELLFYRKDLFDDPAIREDFKKKYKIELAPPKDWFTFNLIARYFTREFNPDSPTEHGTAALVVPTVAADLYSRIWAYGGEVFDRSGNVNFYSEATIKAYSNFAETLSYTNSSLATVSGLSHIIDGNVAMIVTFCSYAPEIVSRSYSSVAGRIGFAPIPASNSIVCGWMLGVNRYTDYSEEAMEFLRWFSRDETAMAYTILGGNSPHTNIYSFPEIRKACPWMKLAFHMFPSCKPRSSLLLDDLPPIDPMLVETIITDTIQNHFKTKEPIEACIRQSHINLCKILENNGVAQKPISLLT